MTQKSCAVEDLARQGLISFTKHKRPISSEDLGQLGLNAPESFANSEYLQVLQILHILCFTVINSESKTHFFLVKFLNSTSEYMNQRRQVFEVLIQGALRELISHDSLSSLVQSQWK